MQSIGSTLISLLSTILREGKQDTDGDVAAQILDSLFDIYADETREYDHPVFVQYGFLETLESINPSFRQKVSIYDARQYFRKVMLPSLSQTKNIDRRKHPDSRGKADAALANLQEFIRYRQSLR